MHELRVELLGLPGTLVCGKGFAHTRSRTVDQCGRQAGLLQHSTYLHCEFLRVWRMHQKAASAVFHHFENATDRTRDYGCAEPHRFEQHHRQTFMVRRDDERVRGTKNVEHIGTVTQKQKTTTDSGRLGCGA